MTKSEKAKTVGRLLFAKWSVACDGRNIFHLLAVVLLATTVLVLIGSCDRGTWPVSANDRGFPVDDVSTPRAGGRDAAQMKLLALLKSGGGPPIDQPVVEAAKDWYVQDERNALPAYVLAGIVLWRATESDDGHNGGLADSSAISLVNEGNSRRFCCLRDAVSVHEHIRVLGLLRSLARHWPRYYEKATGGNVKLTHAMLAVEAGVTIAAAQCPDSEEPEEGTQSLFFLTGSAMLQLVVGDFIEVSQDMDSELMDAFREFDSAVARVSSRYCHSSRGQLDENVSGEAMENAREEALAEAVQQLKDALDHLRRAVGNSEDE